jgi:hypothetical protein
MCFAPVCQQNHQPKVRIHMNEMLLIFSAGVVAGMILGILLAHD